MSNMRRSIFDTHRPKRASFKYTNDVFWMEGYQADVNGAVNIADRYRS